MNYRTLEQWSARGYTVRRGSRATWINGIPMFNRDQVRVRTPYRPNIKMFNGRIYQEIY